MNLRYFTLLLLLVTISFGTSNAAIVSPATVTPAETAATEVTEAEALAAAREYKESLEAMSAKERRQLKREQRREVKSALNDYQGADTNTILLVILAILLPPVAVLVHQGELNSKFWIALLLTLLFYLPGLIYALLVIFGNNYKK
ncbi:YqaE/Pmp3 family membrane protein [Neolewinella xylanilytica]|uniref:YqaE/Pmp3 family membrane protein n=1 Tax=Neolewinella xylanilytica TaxID=1514080 RepID=UPI001B80C4D2|nr:YqaE/Pmp3 family membrane protein [Neolewinella xylanilytica]